MSKIVYIPESCTQHDVVFIEGTPVEGKGTPLTGVFCVECGDITYPAGACPDCHEIDDVHGEGCSLVLL